MNAIKFFLYFGIVNSFLSLLYAYTAIKGHEPLLWILVLVQVLLSIHLIRIYITFPYSKKDFK